MGGRFTEIDEQALAETATIVVLQTPKSMANEFDRSGGRSIAVRVFEGLEG